jgi:hypothetical protein
MYNEDVLDLYPRVPVGARVTVTWQRFNSTEEVASYDRPDYRDERRPVSSRWTGGRWPHERYVAAE